MIDYISAFKLIIAFVVGSLWITGSTILAEKFSPQIGGLIGGVPATPAIALFFIGWTQTPLIASESTVLIPITMGINALSIIVYTYLVKFNFVLGILSFILFWFLLSFSLLIVQFHSFVISLILLVIILFLAYLVVKYILKVKTVQKRFYMFSFSNLAFRAVISGSIITISVVLAKLGGPLVGGVFSSFPAVILSTMIITYIAQGRAFSISVLKILMISSSINVTAYAVAVRFLYPVLGLIGGTISSFSISLVSVYFVFLLIKSLPFA